MSLSVSVFLRVTPPGKVRTGRGTRRRSCCLPLGRGENSSEERPTSDACLSSHAHSVPDPSRFVVYHNTCSRVDPLFVGRPLTPPAPVSHRYGGQALFLWSSVNKTLLCVHTIGLQRDSQNTHRVSRAASLKAKIKYKFCLDFSCYLHFFKTSIFSFQNGWSLQFYLKKHNFVELNFSVTSRDRVAAPDLSLIDLRYIRGQGSHGSQRCLCPY